MIFKNCFFFFFERYLDGQSFGKFNVYQADTDDDIQQTPTSVYQAGLFFFFFFCTTFDQ
jgi:hypothetical protein